MPRDYTPVRDPYDDDPPPRYKEPKALRRMRKQFTYDLQLQRFREVFRREPASDEELDGFVEEFLLERYNSGADQL